jgi:hypothetical protein
MRHATVGSPDLDRSIGARPGTARPGHVLLAATPLAIARRFGIWSFGEPHLDRLTRPASRLL